MPAGEAASMGNSVPWASSIPPSSSPRDRGDWVPDEHLALDIVRARETEDMVRVRETEGILRVRETRGGQTAEQD